MDKEIDFFKGLTTGEGEERDKAINMRYSQLLQIEGDRILSKVNIARQNGEDKEVKRLQDKAKLKVQIIVALEFGLIPSREEAGAVGPRDGDWEDPDFNYELLDESFK